MPSQCPPKEWLGQFLAEQLSPSNEDELESHLQTCDECRSHLERLTAEGDPTPLTELQIHPPLSPEFAQRLEDSLRDSLHSGHNEWELERPEIAGYELLEMIGRGGSSVVYRARHQKLNQIVAIKVLRELASGVDRERFQREVQTLAALRHPNITRAIGAGEYNDRSYLVLEFIPGGSLGRAIAGQPQPPRVAARLVSQLSGAMHAAHAAGFVHRDLKPSNVLLDPHFGQGEASGLDRFVPKVTDLGIVKDLSRDDGFTRTRDCLGTPSYMAPEQVKGSTLGVDCRTDVYALGAVLYELLTGRPPFRAGSPLDTMLQVKHDEPVTPSRFHPKLPRDLETICLKCLEKDPSSRFQTAQLLADDLDRYLQGKPILTRRTRWPSKLWRWCRRNPGWAAAAVISLAILLGLAIGGPLLARRERQLREQALEHERQANLERARVREQFESASQLLESTLDQVLRSARLQDAAVDDVRTGLIRRAVPYYEQFVQDDGADRSVQLRQARIFLQLASVHSKEQNPEKARAAYRRSLEMLESLSRDAEPLDRPTRIIFGTAHMEYGRFLQITDNDPIGAERHYRLALAQRTELLKQEPHESSHRDNAAITMSLLGSLLQTLPSRADEAEAIQSQAVELRDQLVTEFPERTDLRHYAALAHMNLGMHYREQNKHADEILQLKSAWELEREVAKSPTRSLEAAFFSSHLEGELGIAFARAGRRDDAVRHLKSAIRKAEALELTFPAVKKHAELRESFQEALSFAEKQPSESR